MILLTAPSIKSLADLGDEPVVIAGTFAVTDAAMTAALSAAASKSVTLVGGSKKDVDRVLDGEVATAVVAVLSPDEAKDFPELSGLNVFRVPVSSR